MQSSSFSRCCYTRGMRGSRAPEMKGAERRETQGLRSPRAAANRPRTPRMVCETIRGGVLRFLAKRKRAPPGAPRAVSFRSPGHAFCIALDAMPSASSWREVRSDFQVEPRTARVRHACRSREPHPAPPKRCLAKAPFSEQDGPNIGSESDPSQGIFRRTAWWCHGPAVAGNNR